MAEVRDDAPHATERTAGGVVGGGLVTAARAAVDAVDLGVLRTAARWLPAEARAQAELLEPLDRGPFGSDSVYRPVADAVREVVYDRATAELTRQVGCAAACSSFASPALVFDSRFESGSLLRAVRVGEHEYELELERDYADAPSVVSVATAAAAAVQGASSTRAPETAKWFFFSVRGLCSGVCYRLHIVGFSRSESLYGRRGGCLPLLFAAGAPQRGWRRAGRRVSYGPNAAVGGTHALSFDLRVDESGAGGVGARPDELPLLDEEVRAICGDAVYLAQSYPYSYTDLQKYLAALEADPQRGPLVRRELLCESLAGNRCDLLVCGRDASSDASVPTVVLTARVHPSETSASWMIQGLVDELLGPSEAACRLRERFAFRIVPMLNPDGVRFGKTRHSLARVDLNRQYNSDRPAEHPTIFHLKRMMEALNVVVFSDFHGHSAKQNVFAFGCAPLPPGAQAAVDAAANWRRPLLAPLGGGALVAAAMASAATPTTPPLSASAVDSGQELLDDDGFIVEEWERKDHLARQQQQQQENQAREQDQDEEEEEEEELLGAQEEGEYASRGTASADASPPPQPPPALPVRHGRRASLEAGEFFSVLNNKSDLFSLKESNLNSPLKRANSGRVWFYRASRGNILSITIEASSGGIDAGPRSGNHLHWTHYLEIGSTYVEALDEYSAMPVDLGAILEQA
jgi:hypothetical protein